MEKKVQSLLLTAVLKFLLQLVSVIPYALFAMAAVAWGIALFVLNKDVTNNETCPAQHMINLVLASAVSFPVVFALITVIPLISFLLKIILIVAKRDSCGSSTYVPAIGVGFLVLLTQICLLVILIVLTFAKSCKRQDNKFFIHMAAYSICCTIFVGIGIVFSAIFQAFIPIIPDSAFASSIEKKLSGGGSNRSSSSNNESIKYKPIKNFDDDED